jgi:hypothetical protein
VTRPVSIAIALVLGASMSTAACGPMGCPAALLSGVLVERDGQLVVEAPNGEVTPVDWSNYTIRRDGDDLLVTQYWFNVLAREGDAVNLGGGHVAGGADAPFQVCGQVEVVPPA